MVQGNERHLSQDICLVSTNCRWFLNSLLSDPCLINKTREAWEFLFKAGWMSLFLIVPHLYLVPALEKGARKRYLRAPEDQQQPQGTCQHSALSIWGWSDGGRQHLEPVRFTHMAPSHRSEQPCASQLDLGPEPLEISAEVGKLSWEFIRPWLLWCHNNNCDLILPIIFFFLLSFSFS